MAAADHMTGRRGQPTLGLGAVLAILSACASYFATCSGSPIWGLVLAIVALPLGALGLVHSVSPRVRGGFVSVLAVILGLIGIVVATLGILGVILTAPLRW